MAEGRDSDPGSARDTDRVTQRTALSEGDDERDVDEAAQRSSGFDLDEDNS